eukprot:3949335-Prymnesium_polylepis.1
MARRAWRQMLSASRRRASSSASCTMSAAALPSTASAPRRPRYTYFAPRVCRPRSILHLRDVLLVHPCHRRGKILFRLDARGAAPHAPAF